MTHKHKGLSYTLKNLDSNGKAGKALRMQVLRCVLAVGFVLSPWLGGEAYADDYGISRKDGANYLGGNNTVADIYAEQVSGTVGLNRFTKFNVADGQKANLYFQDANGAQVQKLINTVDGRIDIQGTVNAIKNGSFGGDLYFLSSKGMIVGPTGVINAGNLTVLTLPQSSIDDINGNINCVSDYIPSSAYDVDDDATIDIHGKIVASGYINLRAAYINITKADTNNSSTNVSASTMFNTTVNTTNILQQVSGAVAGTALSATQDPETGNIVLSVPRLEAGDYVYLRDSKGINIQDACIQSGDDIELKAIGDADYSSNNKFPGVITLNNSYIRANKNLTIEAGESITINNNSNLSSEGSAKIEAKKYLGGNTFSGIITINQSNVTSNGMNIGAGSTINIGSGSSIDSTDNSMNVYTEMGNITNNGTIRAASQVNIEAGKAANMAYLTNSGTIESTGEGISFTADRLLTNTGTIQANGQIQFTVGGTLTNEGEIKSTNRNVHAHVGRNFYNVGGTAAEGLQRGLIEAGGNVQIDYNLPDTMSVATKENDEAKTPYGIYNSGTMKSGTATSAIGGGGTVDTNSGSGNIWLTSSYNITNYGTMEAGRQITLNARDFLDNYGLIQGVTYLDIKSIMGYVYNHDDGVIRATGGNIDLSSGQANLQIKGDTDGTKKELYRKFTPIIIEGIVEATSDDYKNNQTKEGNINITAHLGDIYINGGTIETKPELGTNKEVKAVAGNVILDAAQNITIGFKTEQAKADDPTTDGDNLNNENEREYYKPKSDFSDNVAKISGTNIKLTLGSEENTVSMSEASSKIRLTSDSEAKGISWSSKIELNASNAVAINTDSMNIVGGTINAGTLAASKDLNITGGKINTNNITAGNELNVTGGEVSSNGALELNGGGNVNIGSGASVSTAGNLNVTSENGSVLNSAALTADNGSVIISGQQGVDSSAAITAGNNVELTSSSAGVNASSITLGGSLQLQGNNIDVDNIQRSSSTIEPLNVKANGIGGTGSAINSLNLNITGNASFDSLNVKNANVTTSGTLEIAELKVEEKAQLTSKAGETPNSVDIYGKNATPEAGSGDVIRDTGDYVTIKIDDKGYEATVVENNDNEGAVRLSTKLVDYDPYETYAEHYGDVADLFGRSDLIEASERSEGETAKDDGKAVLKQDEKGLRIEAKEA